MHKIGILNTLSTVNTERAYPLWITGGNFNMITNLEEKRGGRNKLENEGNNLK